jgi:hypothetical protein
MNFKKSIYYLFVRVGIFILSAGILILIHDLVFATKNYPGSDIANMFFGFQVYFLIISFFVACLAEILYSFMERKTSFMFFLTAFSVSFLALYTLNKINFYS